MVYSNWPRSGPRMVDEKGQTEASRKETFTYTLYFASKD